MGDGAEILGARPRRRARLAVGVAAAALLVAGAVLAPAGAASSLSLQRFGTGLFQPVAGEAVPLHGGSASSLNWSGYVDAGSSITSVFSTFTVPTAGLVPPGFTATWTGIGGFTSNDLIQAGVGEQSLPSAPLLGPQYSAWYEILPAPETPLTGCSSDPNCTVNPGDVMSVDIANMGGDTWKISMSDSTRNWFFAKTLTYASSESSAEWILEAPTLVAAQTITAPVGTAFFGPTSTFSVNGGASQTIAAGNPTSIDMGLGIGPNEATPSGLTNGQEFNVCTYASSCPAP